MLTRDLRLTRILCGTYIPSLRVPQNGDLTKSLKSGRKKVPQSARLSAGGGGEIAIWAMPTWRWWQVERCFPYGSAADCRTGSLNQGFYKSKCFHHVEPDCSSDICSVSEGFVWNEEKFWMWNTLTKWKTQIKKLSPLHHRFCCKSPRIPRQPRKSEFLKGGLKHKALQNISILINKIEIQSDGL